MSTFEAIGGVSSSLRTLLLDRMEPPNDDETNLRVSIGRPVTGTTEVPAEPARVNLYLYRVTENGQLKNQEIPGHGVRGAYGRPPLSLNLHYLITAYGANTDTAGRNETMAHYMLGSAMRVLHDNGVLHDAMTTVRDPAGSLILHESLIGAYERIKVTLEPLSLDDVSKVWTALNHDYRLSAAYQVTVVQIESEAERRYPGIVGQPPVGPQVGVVVAASPHIERIGVRREGDPPDSERPYPYARIGDTLTIRGHGLASETMRVRLGPVDATAGVTTVRDGLVAVTVPDDPALRAGGNAVVVSTGVELGDPPERRPIAESNAGVFVLVPRVDAVNRVIAENGTATDDWEVTGRRLYDERGESLAIVGDRTIVAADYVEKADDRIVLRLTGLAGPPRRLRIRVNTAESVDPAQVIP